MAADSARLCYEPLDSQRREIRLVKILPRSSTCTNDSTVECAMQHFELDYRLKYKALSYQWGPETEMHDILVNGKRLLVRSNLHNFIVQYSKQEQREDLWLWIDQISIHQENLQERNQQVTMMANIFETATEVIIWLGIGTDESIAAFLKILDAEDDIDRRFKDEPNVMCHLIDHTYWSRLWIIQEIMLARRIVMMHGDLHMSAEAFENLCKIRNNIAQHSSCYRVLHFRRSRRTGGYGQDWTWRDACLISKDAGCTDVRDRIYGMLGLLHHDFMLLVDYARSPETLFFIVLNAQLRHKCWTMPMSNRNWPKEKDFELFVADLTAALELKPSRGQKLRVKWCVASSDFVNATSANIAHWKSNARMVWNVLSLVCI